MTRRHVSAYRSAFTLINFLVVVASIAIFFALSGCGGGVNASSQAPALIDPSRTNMDFSVIPNTNALVASTTDLATRSPAPPLTYAEVVAVASEKQPNYEYPSQYAFSTNLDHSGRWLVVVTAELGYSSSQTAKFAGSRMTLVKEVQIKNGNLIIGWYRYWRIDAAFSSGLFQYQAIGLVFPYNTKTDQINIR